MQVKFNGIFCMLNIHDFQSNKVDSLQRDCTGCDQSIHYGHISGHRFIKVGWYRIDGSGGRHFVVFS